MKKKNIFQNILILSLLILVVGRTSYAKYINEIKFETFNIEFIAGDIELALNDTNNEFVIVPGKVIEKDTKLTVKAGSEACYVFVKLEKSNNFDSFIEYEVGNDWTELNENSDIYYCELEKTIVDTDYNIFHNNEIIVKENVEKEKYETDAQNNLTLSFTAYAVQKTSEITSATEAWEFIDSSDNLL